MSKELNSEEVPCNGCTHCCFDAVVLILPQDLANDFDYKTEEHPLIPEKRVLASKNGCCTYLAQEGCSIYEKRPLMCRQLDCRKLAKSYSYTQVRKYHIPIIVWRKGKDLLKSM